MGWLGDELDDQSGRGIGPRTTKDLVEERLFALRNNLFSELSLIFLDTTSLYFEGDGGQSLGQYGHSKDHRPDLKQVILAVVIDAHGRPICSQLWPGNTTDVTSLLPVNRPPQTAIPDRPRRHCRRSRHRQRGHTGRIGRPQHRLHCRRARTRHQGDPRRHRRSTPYMPLSISKAAGRGTTDPLVKQVIRSGQGADGKPRHRRYIVCLNETEAKKDAAERGAILAALEEALRRGDKSLIGNRGYRRFLKLTTGRRFELDPRRIALDALFDGIYVIRVTMKLTPFAGHLALP
jgi:hypothetical protein